MWCHITVSAIHSDGIILNESNVINLQCIADELLSQAQELVNASHELFPTHLFALVFAVCSNGAIILFPADVSLKCTYCFLI